MVHPDAAGRAPDVGAARLPAVSADWLELRAAADAVARSAGLAAQAAALVPGADLVVHDLGSGTGAMMRWLAPRLPRPQRWVLHDADPRLLAEAVRRAAGVPVTTSVAPLEDLRPGDLEGASLVTASALLDVLTRGELGGLVDAVRAAGAPVLLSLTVTGAVALDPADPLDAPLQEAFNDHQRRTLHGRPLLGPDAVEVAAGMLADAGWRVAGACSPWRLGPADAPLIGAWLAGWLAAAVEARPRLEGRAESYRRRRTAQLEARALHVTVQHRDVLGWPG